MGSLAHQLHGTLGSLDPASNPVPENPRNFMGSFRVGLYGPRSRQNVLEAQAEVIEPEWCWDDDHALLPERGGSSPHTSCICNKSDTRHAALSQDLRSV